MPKRFIRRPVFNSHSPNISLTPPFLRCAFSTGSLRLPSVGELRSAFSTTSARETRLKTPKLPPSYVSEIDLYEYTAGRWLHRDQLQRNAHRIQFDFLALREKVVASCPGAQSVVGYEKLEGGFNKVFIFTLDNDSKIVARLPTRVAGPLRLTTGSEVATMKFLSSKTSIPIPKILDWNSDPLNSVGAEYIIMEYTAGVRLSERWDTMNILERMECTKSLSMMIKQMADIDFTAYGSLYFAKCPVDRGRKIVYDVNNIIGPHCGATYWKSHLGESDVFCDKVPDYGPCECVHSLKSVVFISQKANTTEAGNDLASFCAGLIETGLSRIPEEDISHQPRYRGTVCDHVRLLHTCRAVIAELIKDPRIQAAAAPILLHPDFHKRNVFVSHEDPTKITGVIDWQGASIEPAFMFALEIPDFADVPENLPLQSSIMKPEAPDAEELKAASICARTFDAVITGYVPKLHAARSLDETLIRIFRYCTTTWTASATAVRQELINLSEKWADLGLPTPCPYVATKQELVSHEKLFEDLEDAMKLKLSVMRILGANSDGYVPMDSWENARSLLPLIRDRWMESANESGTSADEAKNMFPFDGN